MYSPNSRGEYKAISSRSVEFSRGDKKNWMMTEQTPSVGVT